MGFREIGFEPLALAPEVPLTLRYIGADTLQGNLGEYLAHKFVDADGCVYGLSGAVLDSRMAEIEPESVIEITYTGDRPSKHGTAMRMFRVRVWDGSGSEPTLSSTDDVFDMYQRASDPPAKKKTRRKKGGKN